MDQKNALTYVETKRVVPSRIFQHLSLVQLKPVTGRTHQLRIHLQSIDHPIVGDKRYADHIKTIQGKGLFLCAAKMTFTHPILEKSLSLAIDYPKKFERVLDREEARF